MHVSRWVCFCKTTVQVATGIGSCKGERIIALMTMVGGGYRFVMVSGVSRTKIEEVTLDALRTRQSLVKGERLVRHEMRAVLTQ